MTFTSEQGPFTSEQGHEFCLISEERGGVALDLETGLEDGAVRVVFFDEPNIVVDRWGSRTLEAPPAFASFRRAAW